MPQSRPLTDLENDDEDEHDDGSSHDEADDGSSPSLNALTASTAANHAARTPIAKQLDYSLATPMRCLSLNDQPLRPSPASPAEKVIGLMMQTDRMQTPSRFLQQQQQQQQHISLSEQPDADRHTPGASGQSRTAAAVQADTAPDTPEQHVIRLMMRTDAQQVDVEVDHVQQALMLDDADDGEYVDACTDSDDDIDVSALYDNDKVGLDMTPISDIIDMMLTPYYSSDKGLSMMPQEGNRCQQDSDAGPRVLFGDVCDA